MAALIVPLMIQSPACSQEEGEGYELAYGSLVSKSDDQITISQMNTETDESEDISFAINAETIYDGVESLDELNAGDMVEVLYAMDDGAKTAVMISSGVMEEDESGAMDESYEPEVQ